MALNPAYLQKYSVSHALIIGLNKYLYASPLNNAKQDALAIAAKLASECDFKKENISILLDEEATKSRILQVYRGLLQDGTSCDDRVLFFFAGHGHTLTGNRGEIGYLVPFDGKPGDPNSLIRWDDFTKDADLIHAKHIFFVVDACFGGLAVTRSFQVGSSRFLKDMYQRLSRQVLAAGKADQTVSDGGGPIAGHSIFTGHLLNGLSGNASASDGVVTAYSLMSYVYRQVANDQHSRQTPHFGHIDGDGDVILKAGDTSNLQADYTAAHDILIDFSTFEVPESANVKPKTKVDIVKDLLSEPNKAIALDDLITKEVRSVSSRIADEVKFNVNNTLDFETLLKRIESYEEELTDLSSIVVLLSRWGDQKHLPVFKKIFDRLTDTVVKREGYTVLIGMQWYPLMLAYYYAGITAVSVDNFAPLKAAITSLSEKDRNNDGSVELIVPTVRGILELDRANIFKKLKGYENFYAPRSEYLFKQLQPKLEDLLFLGGSYENAFDRWEILYALAYADVEHKRGVLRKNGNADETRIWGPLGRFGWKASGRSGGIDPLTTMIDEANVMKDQWPPIAAGLFLHSHQRFNYIATRFKTEVVDKLPWY